MVGSRERVVYIAHHYQNLLYSVGDGHFVVALGRGAAWSALRSGKCGSVWICGRHNTVHATSPDYIEVNADCGRSCSHVVAAVRNYLACCMIGALFRLHTFVDRRH